jgi:hypothetical protein
MVSQRLRGRIREFLDRFGDDYDLVEGVSVERGEQVLAEYLRALLSLSEEARRRIIGVLEDSIATNGDHGRLDSWRKAAIGMAKLLEATHEEAVDRREAADVIVRVSRWYHDDNNIYRRFVPAARVVVEVVWGRIEPLYEGSLRH